MLLLVPAGVMALVVLAAISVDVAHAQLVRHQLQLAAASAANDAVTAALDETALRSGAGFSLDPERVHEVVAANLEASEVSPLLAAPPEISIGPTVGQVTDTESVTVELVALVDPLFAAGLPGRDEPFLVRSAATASSDRR